jgi:Uma2 family endonuclease
MKSALKEEQTHYTYADYETWGDDVRYELVNGVPRMLAAPLVKHQSLVGEFHFQLRNFLKGKSCRVFVSPFDVRLFPDKGDHTVYQPDLLVICDKTKIEDGKACKGAPDVVIEILSPSTLQIDKLEKYNNYMKAGVREYWIVDPESKTVNVFVLKNGEYVAYAFGDKDILHSVVLEGCEVKLAEVFNEEA